MLDVGVKRLNEIAAFKAILVQSCFGSSISCCRTRLKILLATMNWNRVFSIIVVAFYIVIEAFATGAAWSFLIPMIFG